ncbi:hypothetical protein BKA70DRAFT_1270652 [Coprinopsis sp. MPI-PUGE-AT-0042]|nr:hypothetical protein BKA70DRAFT_1270652 [Coprinopsis sp. MPI-PUGE-AT-0042]
MSNEQTQDQVRERKRDVLKRPFRQGLHWVGSRLEEFRSRTASPRSTRPSTPQQTELLPADAAPSPRNRDQLLDVPVLLSNLAPGQETLLPSTSVSPAPIDHFNQGDPAPPPPEMSRHQELDIRVESPRPDILQAPTLVLSNESIVSSHHPSQEISAQNPSQALEVTTFPSRSTISLESEQS